MFGDPYANAQKVVAWEGWYEQKGGQYPMKIDNLIVNPTGVMTGNGSDKIGAFTINGFMSQNGTFSFTKQYIGKHSVNYNGSVGSGTLQGNWTLQQHTGTFCIKMPVEEWQGVFVVNGAQFPLKMSVNVDPHGVFGFGRDQEGVYVIKGLYAQATNTLEMTKSYIGAYEVKFQGTMYNTGQKLIVRGQWALTNGQFGDFEMSNPLPPQVQLQMMQFYQAPPIPPTYTVIQVAAPAQQNTTGALEGLLGDLDIIDGDRGDVAAVIDKLKRGKKISGEQIETFVPRIQNEDMILSFLQATNLDNIEDFKCGHLTGATNKCKFSSSQVAIVLEMFPKLSTKPGAIESEALLKIFVFKEDLQKVKSACNLC